MDLDPDIERQWDALFKKVIPNAVLMRSLLENAFGLPPGSLEILQQLPTDLPSVNVAKALHQRSSYKELRGDGMFIVGRPLTIVSNEYQSTHNPGMRIRFAMYTEAAIENNPYLSTYKFRNVLIYSGREAREFYRRRHLIIQRDHVEYVVFDLNSLDRKLLLTGSVYDAILGISHRDEHNEALFLRVLARIENEVSDADECCSPQKPGHFSRCCMGRDELAG